MLYSLSMSFLVAISFVAFITVEAMPANPNLIQHAKQPDGSEIQLRFIGDEFFHYTTDLDGFTVLEDKPSGWFRYAQHTDKSMQDIETSSLTVGLHDPVTHGLQRHIAPSIASAYKKREKQVLGHEKQPNARSRMHETSTPLTGELKSLVVTMIFADHVDRVLPSIADLETLMNSDTPVEGICPTGSVRASLNTSSYGKLKLQSTVAPYVLLPETEAWYADGDSGTTDKYWCALFYALDYLQDNNIIDFRDFDADGDSFIDSIGFFHSGYAAEFGVTSCDGAKYEDRIWSSKWTLLQTAACPAQSRQEFGWTSKLGGIWVMNYFTVSVLWDICGDDIGRRGTIAHELGHFLGLDDLYDTSYDGQGIGTHGLMANSWGWDDSTYYPPIMSAWSKAELGWVTPTLITSDGEYSIARVIDNEVVYKIARGFPTSSQYILIENRQPVQDEIMNPGSGLLVWLIDERADQQTPGYPGQRGWPRNGKHYKISLLQADGGYGLERKFDGADKGNAGNYYVSSVSGVGPSGVSGPYPNTDAIQLKTVKGAPTRTSIHIYDISESGDVMTFKVNLAAASPVPDPTAAPTPMPTWAPIADAPATLEFTQMMMMGTAAGCNTFTEAASRAAVVRALAAEMGLQEAYLEYTNCGEAEVERQFIGGRPGGGMQKRVLVDVSVDVITIARVPITTYPALAGLELGSAQYLTAVGSITTTYSSALEQSVTSGAFDTALRAASTDLGASGTATASVTGVEVSGIETAITPTATPTNADSSDSGLGAMIIIIIVVAAVIVFAGLVVCVYIAFSRTPSSGVAAKYESASQHQEASAPPAESAGQVVSSGGYDVAEV